MKFNKFEYFTKTCVSHSLILYIFLVKPSACELRVAQYEKPLTKGHCPIKSKNDPDKRDPEKLAKKRSERRERSHQLKEKIIKLIESGLQLSEYQARKVLKLKPSHAFFCPRHSCWKFI